MELFWFFRLRFRRPYDFAYDSDFWFSLDHKRSYDSAYYSDPDSVASENQSLNDSKHCPPFVTYQCYDLFFKLVLFALASYFH